MASTGRLAAHSRLSTGLIVTGTGLAHFAFPDYFEPINAVAFPERPREFTYINGGVETVLGLALLSLRARMLTKVLGVAYAFHLLGNVGRSQGISRSAREACLNAV